MPKAGRAPKDVRKPWKSFPPATYEWAITQLVHFSAKPVNSNAAACGVRLAAGLPPLRLPYVGVRAMGLSAVPLDFSGVGGAGSTTAPSQVLAVLEGDANDRFKDVPAEEVAIIRELVERLAEGAEVGCDLVDPRLRQLLMPVDEPGAYVALTPLHASGLSALVDKRVRAEREQEKESGVARRTYRRVANMPVGGSNPQNAGLRVRGMGNPLVFAAPVESTEVRRAYAIRSRGVSLQPSTALLDKFYRWRKHVITVDEATGEEFLATDKRVRGTELKLLREMISDIARRVAAARQHLAQADIGPLAPEVGALLYGAFDAEKRDPGWVRDCAEHIAQAIARHKNDLGVGLSDKAVNALRPEIEQAVREFF